MKKVLILILIQIGMSYSLLMFCMLKSTLYLVLFIMLFLLFFIVMFKNNKKYRKKILQQEEISMEFKNEYKKLYNENKKVLENARIKAMIISTSKYILLISLPLILILMPLFLKKKIEENLIELYGYFFGIMFFIIAIILISKEQKYKEHYINLYKKNIVFKMIQLINNGVNYNLDSIKEIFLMEQEYKKSNFQSMYGRTINTNDYFEVHIDDKTIRISDICVETSGRRKSVLFKGIFACLKTNKESIKYLKISRNKLNIFNNINRLQIDNTEFKKYFNVFSEDKILIDDLISNEIYETIYDFYKKYKMDFEIVFKGNHMYMRFFTEDLFEPKIFRRSRDSKNMYIDLYILNEIIETINRIDNLL